MTIMMMATPRAASTSQNLPGFCPALCRVPASSPIFPDHTPPSPTLTAPHGLGLGGERGLHHQAGTQGGRGRRGAALDAERRGTHGPRPGLRDLDRRREDDAPLPGRRGEQQLLFPLRDRDRKPYGRLYLGRAPPGLPDLPPE